MIEVGRVSLAEELARCDHELELIRQYEQGPETQDKAYLATMGRIDWEREKAIVLEEMLDSQVGKG